LRCGPTPRPENVLDAARSRVGAVFDRAPCVYVAFSGGKDSTALLHLVAEEARRRGCRFGLLFIDWEAQLQATIRFVEAMFRRYADVADPYWIAIPLRTTNACSAIEPEWTCWEPAKREAWVRSLPSAADLGPITDSAHFSFWRPGFTFEQFVDDFGAWFAARHGAACSIGLVGIRTAESLNRYRAIVKDKATVDGLPWTTARSATSCAAYPIYDWRVEDVWTYFGKFGLPYNPVYDLMHKAGLTPHQMRICEPYGDEQKQGLWLYQILEPQTWGAVAGRVEGAHTASIYDREKGAISGRRTITKPQGHTWQSFTKFLLSTMPKPTADHYFNKFAVWRRWYEQRGVAVEDELPGDTGSEDKPSWRRLARVLLKNDYWCMSIGFSPTKADQKYLQRVSKLRTEMEW
jgi:predicted phosphoadenosine phosphosulfate sulfurtransferase